MQSSVMNLHAALGESSRWKVALMSCSWLRYEGGGWKARNTICGAMTGGTANVNLQNNKNYN